MPRPRSRPSGGTRSGARPLATAAETGDAVRPGLRERLGRRRLPLAWLGVAPFFAYTLLFLFIPAGQVLVGAFQDQHGAWTLGTLHDVLRQEQFRNAYK